MIHKSITRKEVNICNLCLLQLQLKIYLSKWNLYLSDCTARRKTRFTTNITPSAFSIYWRLKSFIRLCFCYTEIYFSSFYTTPVLICCSFYKITESPARLNLQITFLFINAKRFPSMASHLLLHLIAGVLKWEFLLRSEDHRIILFKESGILESLFTNHLHHHLKWYYITNRLKQMPLLS